MQNFILKLGNLQLNRSDDWEEIVKSCLFDMCKLDPLAITHLVKHESDANYVSYFCKVRFYSFQYLIQITLVGQLYKNAVLAHTTIHNLEPIDGEARDDPGEGLANEFEWSSCCVIDRCSYWTDRRKIENERHC